MVAIAIEVLAEVNGAHGDLSISKTELSPGILLSSFTATLGEKEAV